MLFVVLLPIVGMLIIPPVVVPPWREPVTPGVGKPEPAAAVVARFADRAATPGDGGTVERLWPTLTMISPNCSGSVSRPRVSMGSWKGWLRDVGGWPIRPAGASRFWLRIALATSLAVMFSDASFCGSSQARML